MRLPSGSRYADVEAPTHRGERQRAEGYASDDTFVEYLSSTDSEGPPSPPPCRRICYPSTWQKEHTREDRLKDARDFLVLCVLLVLLLDVLLRERKLLWHGDHRAPGAPGAPGAGGEEEANYTLYRR
jgi:hypothetical protein